MALLKRTKQLNFERTYRAPQARVWQAWTDPDLLRQWWGPEHTVITDCELDLRIDGRLYLVMEADEGMGKYQGTRWPMEGTFTTIEPQTRLAYDARSWTEGKEDTATIEHTNDVALSGDGASTTVRLTIDITRIGSKAKMAAFGMKWGYKAQLDALGTLVESS